MNELSYTESRASFSSLSLSKWMIKGHVQAYRACCQGLDTLAISVIQALYSPIKKCVKISRQCSSIDLCMISSLRMINGIYSTILKKELISSDSLKTLAQQKRDREIKELRMKFGEHSIYTQCCKEMANYIHACIPRYLGESLVILPTLTESFILFKLGYSIRYINYQLEKRLNYKEAVISSVFGRSMQAIFGCLRTQAAHCLMTPNNLSLILNFEHLFLRAFNKILNAPQEDQNLKEVITRSLALSFSQQKQVDEFLSQFSFTSDKEAFIARLEWYKRNHVLPKGLPDPDQVRLTVQNLEEELDKALNKYLEGHIRQFLIHSCPQDFKKGFLKVFYFLEGKDLLAQVFAYLISEFGIKQIADPHLFALAILTGHGVEVMDYELEGFGREKTQLILETGQKILSETLKKETSWSHLVDIFNQSGLRPAPKSFEGIQQKIEAKKRLKNCIASMIYKMIKADNFQHPDNLLKNLKEKTQGLPLIGSATVSLHLLINGTFFSLGYLFRDQNNHTSYLEWMIKNFLGHKSFNYLADRIIELIYHPSWRITLMQLIDSLISSLESPKNHSNPLDTSTLKEDIKTITSFLFDHFTQSSDSALLKNIKSIMDRFTGEETLDLFLNSSQSEESSLEKVLKSLVPTIKELTLYTHMIDSFRKECLCFEGDAKFWEYFLRESLNQLIARQIQEQLLDPKKISLTEIFAIREQLVDRLLSMNQQEMRSFLSKAPTQELSFSSQQWEMICHNVIDEEFCLISE